MPLHSLSLPSISKLLISLLGAKCYPMCPECLGASIAFFYIPGPRHIPDPALTTKQVFPGGSRCSRYPAAALWKTEILGMPATHPPSSWRAGMRKARWGLLRWGGPNILQSQHQTSVSVHSSHNPIIPSMAVSLGHSPCNPSIGEVEKLDLGVPKYCDPSWGRRTNVTLRSAWAL